MKMSSLARSDPVRKCAAQCVAQSFLIHIFSLSGFLVRCSLRLFSGASFPHALISGFLSCYEILCLQQSTILILPMSQRPRNHMCFGVKGEYRAHKTLIFIRERKEHDAASFLFLPWLYSTVC